MCNVLFYVELVRINLNLIFLILNELRIIKILIMI